METILNTKSEKKILKKIGKQTVPLKWGKITIQPLEIKEVKKNKKQILTAPFEVAFKGYYNTETGEITYTMERE